MKILFISDLHLGDGSGADDFGDNDERLVNWINSFEPDRVYLVGDIYDLWQFKLKRIKKAHQYLCGYFRRNKVVQLLGNHDYKIFGAKDIILQLNGKKVLVVHGHQGDKGMGNPFLRAFVWLLAIPERLGLKDIDNPEKLYFTRKQHQKAIESTKKYAEKMFHKGYDIVICGHTHEIGIITYTSDIRKVIYGNCGTCMGGKLEGLLYDTDIDILTKV